MFIREFKAKVGSDGRVYIPNSLGSELGLENSFVKVQSEGQTRYRKISYRDREYTEEFSFTFDSDFKGEKLEFKIEKVHERELDGFYAEVLGDFNCAIQENRIVVLDRKTNVFMNKEVDFESLAHYLGAFFADGMKKGNGWGISASTFEQANYYLDKHRRVFEEDDLRAQLSYTYYGERDEEKLKRKWRRETGLEINSVVSNESHVESAPNRNKYGTVYIRCGKENLGVIYNRMMDLMIEKILSGEFSEETAREFVLGMLEGDGAANAKARGHVNQTLESSKGERVKSIYRAAGFDGELYEEESKSVIRIGSLELLSQFDHVGDRLFKYYPKRRRRAMSRLLQTGAAQFLLNEEHGTTGPVIKKFREENLMKEDSQDLTEKGEGIKKRLEKVKADLEK